MQIVNGAIWQERAEENRGARVVQRAPRGLIVDRYGKEIATNQPIYTLVYTENKQIKEQLIADEDQRVQLIATAPARVRKNSLRIYPYGPVLAHILGYIQRPFLSSDVVYGKSGLERIQNDTLAGKDGYILFERNAKGEPTRSIREVSPEPGSDIQLSLDAEMSQVAFEALGNQRGVVLVSDPRTGELLVAVSKPSFLPYTDDELSLAGLGDTSQWQAGITEGSIAGSIGKALSLAHNPFLFRPISAAYPPGSVFKIVTALAGLERQVIDEKTIVRDEGTLKVGEFEYQNWYWRQFGRVEGDISVVRALARSNDIFFYKLAEWIGPQALSDFAKIFSFGQRTGVDWPGEKIGIVPDPIWKQQFFGEKWFLGNTYHMGIGQGDVLVTPLQVHLMMSAVAERGRKCQPTFFFSSQHICQELSLQETSLASITQGLRQACSAGGTAYPFFSVTYDVMCKTGTAEFGAENEKGHRSTHGWFVAAVSKDQRQAPESPDFSADIVITVLTESDESQPYKEGSRDAAPVAKAIADWWVENRSQAP